MHFLVPNFFSDWNFQYVSATAYTLEQNNKLEGGKFLGRQNFKSREKSKFFLKNVGFDQKSGKG